LTPIKFLLILRAHYKAAIAVFLLTVATGVTTTLLMPKRYLATTDLVFDVKTPDPIAGMMLPVVPGYMGTQVDIIRSDRVALAVVKFLRLDQNPAVMAQWMEATEGKGRVDTWFADVLRNGLIVTPASGSNIISVSYASGDPSFAALVANAFAQVYIDANIELRVEPARQYARWFGEQGKSMRDALEKAQSKLSEFQQQKGIVAKDELLDIETAKLNDLSAQLTVVQGQTAESKSKQRSGSDTLPDVMQNGLLQGIKADILKLEARLQETAGNLGRNHPQYQRMESELSTLKRQLEVETKRFTSSFSASSQVGQNREADLKAAITAQKRKLLELRNERDQLAVLQRDVDAAQNAFDNVSKRFNQTSLESQVTQSNISVLNIATDPVTPASPNVPKNILYSTLVGIFLGFGIAFLLEMLNRRIRSVDDLAQMLPVPVLASIGPQKQSRRLLNFMQQRTSLLAR